MVDRLGWTLLHFVWEGAAAAILLAYLLLFARRPATRYALALAALALMAAMPVGTFFALAPSASAFAVAGPLRFSAGETIVGVGHPSPQMPLLVGGWAFGVVLLSLRFGGTLLHLERWKRRHARPAPPQEQARFDALAHRLGLSRRVLLLLSDRLEVPSAWGVLRPVVVLPASLVTGLPPDQIEGILLHELAHVRRHDYLVNLAQSVVETSLFYHPAVWWVSSVIRREREHLCDDVVVALGDPLPYARALLHLEERRRTPRPALSAKEGNLMNRIARILSSKPAPTRLSPLAPGLAALAIVGLALGGVFQAEAQAAPKKTPEKAAAPLFIQVRVAKPPVAPRRSSGGQTRGWAPEAKALQADRNRLVAESRALRLQLVQAQREIAALKAQGAARSRLFASPSVAPPASAAERDLAQARATMAQDLAARQQELTRLRTSIAEAQAQAVAAQEQVTAADRLKAERLREAQNELQQARAESAKAADERQKAIASAKAEIERARKVPVPGDLPAVGRLFQTDPAAARLRSMGAAKAWSGFSGAGTLNGRAFEGFNAAPGTKAFKGMEGLNPLKGKTNLFQGAGGFGAKEDPAVRALLQKAFETPSGAWAKGFGRSPLSLRFGGYVLAGKNGTTNVSCERAPFTAVLRDLASQAGLSVVILPGDYRNVNVVLKDVPWSKALKILCDAAGAKWMVKDGCNVVSPGKR